MKAEGKLASQCLTDEIDGARLSMHCGRWSTFHEQALELEKTQGKPERAHSGTTEGTRPQNDMKPLNMVVEDTAA